MPCLPTNHCDEAAYEAEVGEVVGVDGRGWVNLQAVVALACILKQAVHGIQHFVGQQEEPLSVGPQDRGKAIRKRRTINGCFDQQKPSLRCWFIG